MSEKTREQIIDEKINKFVPMPVKYFFQRMIYGFDERDMLDPRWKILESVSPVIDAFFIYEREGGLRLPKEFETNPGEWLSILYEIQYAFNNYKPGVKFSEEEQEMIKRGFLNFGVYFTEMWEREKLDE